MGRNGRPAIGIDAVLSAICWSETWQCHDPSSHQSDAPSGHRRLPDRRIRHRHCPGPWPGGGLSVKLEPRSGTACALSVCNDGSTLPDGFDPVASKGLGMSLVLSLVEQIGGELLIDRGEDNKGTRFTVLFSR